MTTESIFRAYDIRGIYNEEIDPSIVAKIGMAFGTYLGGKGKVCLGRDGRISSLAMEQALISGLVSSGMDVVSIGLLPIPVANYWTWKNEFRGGVYITASHNPAEYNGIRFRHGDGTGYTSGNEDIKEIFQKGELRKADWDKIGELHCLDPHMVISDYLNYVAQFSSANKRLKVVIDPGNGVASTTAPAMFRRAGMTPVTINAQIDGTFPGRPSEPSEETLGDLRDVMRVSGADLGIAYDGDGDRCVFVDERGELVPVEKITVMLGKELMKEYSGPVITTVSGSMTIKEEIEKAGGEVITIRVGDVFVARAIKEYGAIFSAEDSSHFFIPIHYSFDDPMLTSLFLADLIARSGGTLSELVANIPSYPRRKSAHACEDDIKFEVVDKVVGHYRGEREKGKLDLNTIDGAKIIYEDGWGLIRCSNTQPKVRITVEARTHSRLEELSEEFQGVFREKREEARRGS